MKLPPTPRAAEAIMMTFLVFLAPHAATAAVPCDPNGFDVCSADPCTNGKCHVECDLNVALGTSSTNLVVQNDDMGTVGNPADDELVFSGTDESGDAFECRFDHGVDPNEVENEYSRITVLGTDEPDEIKLLIDFWGLLAETDAGEDTVECDFEVDFLYLDTGDDADHVSCSIDECGDVTLGAGNDVAIFDGPALSPSICGPLGTSKCPSPCRPTTSTYFVATIQDQIETRSGADDDCVLGTPLGVDKWWGGSGDDDFNGRSPPGTDLIDGGSGIDHCWPHPGCELAPAPGMSCP